MGLITQECIPHRVSQTKCKSGQTRWKLSEFFQGTTENDACKDLGSLRGTVMWGSGCGHLTNGLLAFTPESELGTTDGLVAP